MLKHDLRMGRVYPGQWCVGWRGHRSAAWPSQAASSLPARAVNRSTGNPMVEATHPAKIKPRPIMTPTNPHHLTHISRPYIRYLRIPCFCFRRRMRWERCPRTSWHPRQVRFPPPERHRRPLSLRLRTKPRSQSMPSGPTKLLRTLRARSRITMLKVGYSTPMGSLLRIRIAKRGEDPTRTDSKFGDKLKWEGKSDGILPS